MKHDSFLCCWTCWPNKRTNALHLTKTRAQALKDMISPKTKMVALVHVSNTLGAVLPVHDVAEAAHKVRPAPGLCTSLTACCCVVLPDCVCISVLRTLRLPMQPRRRSLP